MNFLSELKSIFPSVAVSSTRKKLEWEGRLGKWNREKQSFESGITEEQFKRIFTTLVAQKNEWSTIEPFRMETDRICTKTGIRTRQRSDNTKIATKKKLLGQWTYRITEDLAIRFALSEEEEVTVMIDPYDVKHERKKKRCSFHMAHWTYDLSYVECGGNMSYEVEVEYLPSLTLANIGYAAQSLQYRMNAFLLLFNLSAATHKPELVSSFPVSQTQKRDKQKRVWHLCR